MQLQSFNFFSLEVNFEIQHTEWFLTFYLQSINHLQVLEIFTKRDVTHSGYVHAHNTFKVIHSVVNHLKIASEEYFEFQEFFFNEISHAKSE